MDKDAPILDAEIITALCLKCGRCCIDTTQKKHIGGSAVMDAWLRWGDECRFLLPGNAVKIPELGPLYRQRQCAIHRTEQLGYGYKYKPVRPQLCRDAPTRGNLDCLPDCPVTRAAKEELYQ